MIDTAEVISAHQPDPLLSTNRPAPLFAEPGRADEWVPTCKICSGRPAWPCLPYRLADALVAAERAFDKSIERERHAGRMATTRLIERDALLNAFAPLDADGHRRTAFRDGEGDLASGKAVLRYIVSDEAWYASAANAPRSAGEVCEFSIGIDPLDGGTYGEWVVMLHEFDGRHAAAQHRVFDDALAALAALPNYWPTMAGVSTREELEDALIGLGFTDKTPRVSPYAPESNRCPTCGSERSA